MTYEYQDSNSEEMYSLITIMISIAHLFLCISHKVNKLRRLRKTTHI